MSIWVLVSGWVVSVVTFCLLLLERIQLVRSEQKAQNALDDLFRKKAELAACERKVERRDEVLRTSKAQALLWRNQFNSAVRAMDAGDMDTVRGVLRELAVGGLERRLRIIAEGDRDGDPTVPDRPAAKAKARDV